MPNYENIFEAAKSGTVEDVKFFIEKMGDSAHSANMRGDTLLHIAAESNGDIAVLEYLISQDVKVKAKNNFSMTPLHNAAESNGNVEVLKYLVSKGAEVKAEDVNGETPLHAAAHYNGNIAVLEYLISQDADIINAKSNTGITPLHEAAKYNPNFLVVRFLIAQGAEINAKTNSGETPLDYVRSDVKWCRDEAKRKWKLTTNSVVSPDEVERFTQEAKEYDRKCEVAEKKESVLREAGGQCGSGGSGGSGSSGCLVLFAALGTLLTSGICGLVFALLASLR